MSQAGSAGGGGGGIVTPVSVPNGGTAVNTLLNHGVVIGQGAAAVHVTTAGLAGQVLTSNGPALDPTFQAVPGALTWSDQGVNATVAINTGSFATAAITLTLPVAPIDGSTCKFIVDNAGALIVQASAGQRIRIGIIVSAVAGTATSSSRGDSLELIYRATNSTWLALTAAGTWDVV